ncbi:hypothetical protein ACFSTE_16545 [Aquimarina hainanensis]|uniref:DUF2846 domain-containing protein n=1 Tax=Aquimarina hainanensis TaxID=1578017 RepID=A0ABW5NB24_9FLAO
MKVYTTFFIGLIWVFFLGCDRIHTTMLLDYAEYAEHTMPIAPLKEGRHTRILNTTIEQYGESIRLDKKTGIISLSPGSYNISVSSTLTDSSMPAIVLKKGGYCLLRYVGVSDDEPIAIGSISKTTKEASTIDTYFNTDVPVRIFLSYEVEDSLEKIKEQVKREKEQKMTFSHINIQQL